MPTKKKSCFQITSVIQAQVAANHTTDDTESLDDPDESHTEDVSSEIFDVSRTDLGVCERSSSEETLNNVGEHQEGTAAVNGGLSYKSIGTGGRNTPLNVGGSVPVPAATQCFVPTPATHPLSVSSSGAHTNCSSRFRVIKLDHGTGEPFRRGRWTCTDFYDKDSDTNRTVDSVKPTMTHDHSIDRDNGVGASRNFVASPSAFSAQAVENAAIHSSEPLQQGYSVAPQIGSVASAFQPTGYATTSQQVQVNVQPVASQPFIPNSLNGVHQGTMLQKSLVMPPATQPQQLAYSNMSFSQPDYQPQHFGSSTQNFTVTSLPVAPSSSQGPSPVITPAAPGGLPVLTLGGEAALAPGFHLQAVNAPAVVPVTQTQPLGGLSITAASKVTINTQNVIQNVPATVPSATSPPLGQTLAAGALVSSYFNNQSEDTRPKLDPLPQPISSVAPGGEAVKPLNTEGLSLPAPTVSFFGIPITMDGDDDSASGASVVAIDNKIEQAMDLVKSHLMYAVREEVEVLKEQIKELYERNSVLERENAVLKSLANSEQLTQLSSQLSPASSVTLPQLQHQHSLTTNNSSALGHYVAVQSVPHQPNITSA